MPVDRTAAKTTDDPKETKVTEVTTNRDTAPTESSKQDLPEVKETVDTTPRSYVHLADGTVLRVDDEDLPGSAGTFHPHGFWQRGNKVYQVIGVYPVETTVESE